MNVTISLRVQVHLWLNDNRRSELLARLREYRGTIEEVAFFTSITHPPLPYATISHYAERLAAIIPEFKALGLRTGINHLATIGHLDENLDNSLNEPWRKMTDINGVAAKGSYCPLDSRFQAYVRDCYKALAEAAPDFIWLDDDIRMGHHPPAGFPCFCDLCLERFAEETATPWTRDGVRAVLNQEDVAKALPLRIKWLAHNRRIIDDLFALIRAAVDEVNPSMTLGYMPCAMLYEGAGFDEWGKSLAGARGLPVKWRPGGGFYTDNEPLGLLRKAHGMGRIAGAIPSAYTDIQYEHENFPYQKLKKSETVFVVETGAALAAGCTGVALNLMGISPDPFDEYMPYFDRIRDARGFFERLVSLAARSPAEGLWPAVTRDVYAGFNAGRTWNGPGGSNPLDCLTELAEIGLPSAYSRGGAKIHLLTGEAVRTFKREELELILSEAAIVDGSALQILQDLGLADMVGFEVTGTRDYDTIERFTDDSLNTPHSGWWRDCRPAFWRVDAFMLRPLSDQARTLAELIDFNRTVLGPTMGVFENRLGGRVAILGYYPWTSLQNLAKSTQMKNLCRWLSRDSLPAYISSFHKVALWCRRDPQGKLVIPLINASLDAVTGLRLHVREDRPLRLMRLDGGEEEIKVVGRDGEYTVLELPSLGGWEMVLVSCHSE